MTFQIESGDQAQSVPSDEEKAAAVVYARPKSSGPFVLYTGPREGTGTRAEIRPADWAKQGIVSTRTSVWCLQNKWRIAVSQLTDEQVDYLLNNTKRFELVDAKGNKVDS